MPTTSTDAHVAHALERFYTMATAWDKRRSYAMWVGYARLLAVRAERRMHGLESLPSAWKDGSGEASGVSKAAKMESATGHPLVSIKQLSALMP